LPFLDYLNYLLRAVILRIAKVKAANVLEKINLYEEDIDKMIDDNLQVVLLGSFKDF